LDTKKIHKKDSKDPWNQSKDYRDYPDFNYEHNAMACDLILEPSCDKKGKHGLHIYFDSFEEGKLYMENVKKEFTKAFFPVYKMIGFNEIQFITPTSNLIFIYLEY